MAQVMDWYLKCPRCGFEFSVLFDATESEENKKTLRECPCGEEMEIVREEIRSYDPANQSKADR